MEKRILLNIILLLLIFNCSAQISQLEGSYVWKSNYYIGDFQKICFYNNNTFYYQRHQNDVIPDYYSKGVWQKKADSIELISIEPYTPDSQIVNSGKAIKDSLFIKFVDIKDGRFLPRVGISIYNDYNKKTMRFNADSLGILKIKINKDYKYIKCWQYVTYNRIFLNIDSLDYENIIIKMDRYTIPFIYKDVSDMKLFIKSENELIEEYDKNKFISFYKQE